MTEEAEGREREEGGREGVRGAMMLLTSEDEAGDPFFPFKEWNCGSTYTGQTCPLAVLGLSAEESLRMKWRGALREPSYDRGGGV